MVEKYQQFYSNYKDKLFSYLLYKSGNTDLASDIMQESFTRHYQHYGRQPELSPTLLFTIARNALVDYQRGVTTYHKADIPAQSSVPDEEQAYLVKEEHGRIHEAMQKLPEQEREILTLAVGGMAYKEIAAIFDVSVANVKVKIHRARTELKKMLKEKVL